MKKTKKVLEWITKVEYAIMIVAFVLMVLCYFTSVVNRNFIKASMPWAEELALYSMTFMALLGTEVGLRDGTQVAVTAVIEKLHGMTLQSRGSGQAARSGTVLLFHVERRCSAGGKAAAAWSDNTCPEDPDVVYVFVSGSGLRTDPAGADRDLC